ncbi:hypothetical protein GOP47_0020147 [Adiantum capillus-veneris]|uniref:Uncharacterized protein n=1 Tax=Adiantum capillus-veneris TaxID=13818 RepID=A0A9D4Z998_ADICA|nr:hypothetical protein GOP47_0020147 [Adiantum capillus-veneris]
MHQVRRRASILLVRRSDVIPSERESTSTGDPHRHMQCNELIVAIGAHVNLINGTIPPSLANCKQLRVAIALKQPPHMQHSTGAGSHGHNQVSASQQQFIVGHNTAYTWELQVSIVG